MNKIGYLVYTILPFVFAVRHNISLQNEQRKHFPLSTFGFYTGGKLVVDIKKFTVKAENDLLKDPNMVFGFSLQNTKNDGVSSYMEKTSKKCILTDHSDISTDMKIILFVFDLTKRVIRVERFGDKNFQLIKIDQIFNESEVTLTLKEWLGSHTSLVLGHPETCDNSTAPINELKLSKEDKEKHFSGKFKIGINCTKQEGLYNLFFHNCINYIHPGSIAVDLELLMMEHNRQNFLSAGEMPLPIMYGFMSCWFFMAAFIWTVYLNKHRMWTYKIHWLMAVVAYIKSLSVAFHALNFYFIGKGGLHVTTWAVLFYVIHLLKGALLFTAIVLIGTGYFFVKHVLSSKEKKLFMVVIPLQIILNVAQIIIESTEEGERLYKFWTEVSILIDLLCCGAILLPIVWSIKHLTEAAKTDGKAAISLVKLKLFRQFYIMIVCYIYFTRIIVYLIKITVPFQYMWLDEFFTEAATFIFFIFTGVKFRPVNDNPYLHIPQDDEEPEIEMNDISVHPAFGERLTRVNRLDTQPRTT